MGAWKRRSEGEPCCAVADERDPSGSESGGSSHSSMAWRDAMAADAPAAAAAAAAPAAVLVPTPDT